LSPGGAETVDSMQQQQSKDSIVLPDRNPDAIDVLLEYLYTLSDRLEPEWVDELDFEKTVDIYDKLPSECEHLIAVLVSAARYGISDLAELARERLHDRLNPLETHFPSNEATLQTLLCRIAKALYSEQDVDSLQRFREMVVGRIFQHWDQLLASETVQTLMLAHTELGWELTRSAISRMQKQRHAMDCMLADLPQTKRKKYESSQE
jgi:hypothetical protein